MRKIRFYTFYVKKYRIQHVCTIYTFDRYLCVNSTFRYGYGR